MDEDRNVVETTKLLRAWREGDQDALEQLIPRVYDELSRIAHRAMARESNPDHLETQALVHEAYVRLIDADASVSGPTDDVLALAELLEKLAAEEPRVASVVELVFFGGLRQEEVAKALAVSLSSVERDLRFAKTWLRLQLRG